MSKGTKIAGQRGGKRMRKGTVRRCAESTYPKVKTAETIMCKLPGTEKELPGSRERRVLGKKEKESTRKEN